MPNIDSERWQVADLTIDVSGQTVRRGRGLIILPPLSFKFLLALVRSAPRLMSTDDLMERVWVGVFVNAETITQRAKLLRDALGDDPMIPSEDCDQGPIDMRPRRSLPGRHPFGNLLEAP